MKKINNRKKDKFQYGFTLVEVIVTIAIIGIITVPIALIFQGALAASIETREQLVSTQLSQKSVEAIKFMNMELFERDILSDLDAQNEVQLTSSNIPGINIPNDYTIFFTSKQEQFASDAKYKMNSTISNTAVSGDLVINLNQDELSIASTDIKEEIDESDIIHVNVTKTTKVILGVEKDVYKIQTEKVDSDDSIEIHTEEITDNYQGVLNLKISNPIKTEFMVNNSSGQEFSIYVYESQEDINKPDIILNTGNNSVYRNISEQTLFEYRIYAFEVRVEKDGEVLSEVVTTRLAKE
jgi:prepilin-type N-terminal cleavage/methylation domain-containing protein